MFIAGIDPSLRRTAVCVGNGTIDQMSIQSSPAVSHEIMIRLARWERHSENIVEACRVARIVFIEGYSYGSQHASAVLCEFGGILRYKLKKLGKELVEVPPTSLKQFITRKGSGSKARVGAAVMKQWEVGDGWEEDEFFAYGLYRLGLVYCNRHPAVTPEQREVVRKLRL